MTDATSAALERVPTGISGLDSVLEGGFFKGGVYMVQGAPGSGKTILGNQVCFNHARGGGSAVYVTLLAESHTRMLAHMRGMSFFEPKLIPERVYYVSCFKVLEGEGLSGLLRVLRKVTASRKASFLVLDGLVSAEEASPSPRDFKKFIHELQSITALTDCTALLLSSTERPSSFRPEHTMVDGILELSDDLNGLRSVRHLHVRKMRGADPVRGKHTLEITNEGIIVWPRIETWQRSRSDAAMTADTKRMGFDIEELDRMLYGGLPSRSTTMVLGPTGCGKTTLGLQFLAAGARAGEPGVYFGFHERPEQLIEKSGRIGLGSLDRRRLIDLVWQPAAEGVIDVLAQKLLHSVQRLEARRLFLDGLQGLERAAEFPERTLDALSALLGELERLGVTTLFSAETRDLFGARVEAPLHGVCAVTHNIILLRHVELEAHRRRLISISKLRDSEHDVRTREFRITDRGISVAGTFEAANHARNRGRTRRPLAGRKRKK